MGGGGGGQATTSKTELSPEFKPYVNFALEEAKKAYQAPSALAGQQLYVDPSEATNQALGMAQSRAMAGNPLVPAAQQQMLQTIQGNAVNPFLQGALSAAYQPTVQAAQEGFRGLQSQLSSAGRYGSDAAAQMFQRAGQGFGTGIGNAMANMTYQSSEAERARQMAAIQNAPAMAAADYNDIDKLLKVGQAQEGYGMNRIQGLMAQENLPFDRLQRTASIFYGAPMEQQTVSQATPTGGK